jgi:hypothetical protein
MVALLAGSVAVAAPAKKPAPPPAAPAKPAPVKPVAPEPEERIIEKRDADYVLRLTLRPGNVKTNHVAQADVEIIRTLQIPDPVTGDQMPITGIQPVATVKPPEPPPGKGQPPQSPSVSYLLWPATNPGVYNFHFTPTEDGIYEVTIAGSEAAKSGEEESDARAFKATYRIGVGTAAAQTEQSQGGTAIRRTSRRPIGGDSVGEREKRLIKFMRELSDHFLALDAGSKDAAADAHSIALILAQTKGLAPEQSGGDATEYDKLTTRAAAAFDEYATAVGVKNAKTHPSLETLESVGCTQCHAKYRFQITDELSAWPKFSQKAVGQ